jgi:SAM-dependent methyltransferase
MNSFNFLIHDINKKIALSLPYKGRVIDLGCGTASYKEDVLKVANEYIGVDWENSPHDQTNVDIFADLTKRLPFDDHFADTVVSFQVMEHLPEPDFFLSECYRILKKNGKLFITVPFMWHIHEAPYDYYRYTRYGLTYMLKKNGFTDIEIKENTGFWQMWILKFNYHTVRFAKGIFKYLWIPVWWIGQTIAPILDRYDKSPKECASYTVLARKRQ